MTLAAGTKLGPYEVTAPLGSGGMGEVYRARDPRLSRDVAVKVLPPSFATDADRLRRFEQEARATGALNHPNILAVHDVGAHEGAPYVVSELLEGDTLRERIGAAALPVRKAVEFATQIARGLAAAHDKGIVHRDLKPDNVFVTKDGRVKILDFGLAKLVGGEMLTEAETNTHGGPAGTDAGKVLGTVGYMSPEQVRAQPADQRSDIFSFGSVLYEMLSGRRAFRGTSAVETMNAILKEDPPELSETNRQLPPALERIVSHCLEKNPEERFQSARDIAFDLEQLSGSTTTATPISGTAPARFGLPLLLGGMLLALGLGVGAGRFSGAARVEPPSLERLTFRREEIRPARFAPDGRSVVFESTVTGEQAPALFSAQDGSAEARHLGLTDARLAGISSKGELAVLVRSKQKESGARTLALIPMSGGAPREVVEDVDEADWGPDGSSLAVLRWTGGGLVRLEFPAGKELYTAASLNGIRVSPRGDRIAFTEHPTFGDNRGDVSVIDLEGEQDDAIEELDRSRQPGLVAAGRRDPVQRNASRYRAQRPRRGSTGSGTPGVPDPGQRGRAGRRRRRACAVVRTPGPAAHLRPGGRRDPRPRLVLARLQHRPVPFLGWPHAAVRRAGPGRRTGLLCVHTRHRRLATGASGQRYRPGPVARRPLGRGHGLEGSRSRRTAPDRGGPAARVVQGAHRAASFCALRRGWGAAAPVRERGGP